MQLNFKKPKINFDKLKSIPARAKRINLRQFNWTTVLAILSYLSILVIIPLIVSKNKPFVRFHAKQGVILLAYFSLAIFTLYLPAVPYLFALFYLICVICGIVNVIRGGEKHLPIIGKLADKI